MKIAHNLLVDGDAVTLAATANQSPGIRPLYLVMHYTAGLGLDGTIAWLCNPAAKASAHLVIGRDGRIVQMVAFNRRAWHAGLSRWGDIEGLNAYAIGIELDNAGRLQRRGDGAWVHPASGRVVPAREVIEAQHKNEPRSTGWHAYTEAQLSAAEAVARVLHDRYGFIDVLGHDDIAPARKVDPGPAFPIASFTTKVMGRG
jgi:N-acetylmuramoyl-L-alanine amidase